MLINIIKVGLKKNKYKVMFSQHVISLKNTYDVMHKEFRNNEVYKCGTIVAT